MIFLWFQDFLKVSIGVCVEYRVESSGLWLKGQNFKRNKKLNVILKC